MACLAAGDAVGLGVLPEVVAVADTVPVSCWVDFADGVDARVVLARACTFFDMSHPVVEYIGYT